MNILQRHPFTVALAGLSAILVAIIAVEAGFGVGAWRSRAAAPAKPAPAVDTKLVPPIAASTPEQAFPETTNRPLFTPTRRPAPAAPVAANTMVKGQFILQGVIAVGDQRTALLREKSSGRVHRVERGKEVNGITLATVENDKVTLTQGGDQEVLPLQVQKGTAVAAAPAPAAPAAPSAGPFGPAPGATPAQPARAAPTQPPPGAAPTPAQPAAPGAPTTPNPAARSAFGPFSSPAPAATTSSPDQAQPLTPEELLARRRARRAQQQQPQNQ